MRVEALLRRLRLEPRGGFPFKEARGKAEKADECGTPAIGHEPEGPMQVRRVNPRIARSRLLSFGLVPICGILLLGCFAKVQIEAPKDPIVINLNVKIEQEIRVRVDKDVEDLLADNPDLF